MEKARDAARGTTSRLHDVHKRNWPSELARERTRITRALESAGWNMKVAADKLGVGLTTLYRWMPRYGIPTKQARREQEARL